MIWARALACTFATLFGCASTADTPLLDQRVPSLRPSTAEHAGLISRSVCDRHATVNVWFEWGQKDEIRVSLFDSHKCQAAQGLFMQSWDHFEEGDFVDGERAVFSRDPEAPASVIVMGDSIDNHCAIDLPPLGPGTIHVIVEVDEVMATTIFDTFTPAQDRRFEGFLRKRDRFANACRERQLKPRRRRRAHRRSRRATPAQPQATPVRAQTRWRAPVQR